MASFDLYLHGPIFRELVTSLSFKDIFQFSAVSKDWRSLMSEMKIQKVFMEFNSESALLSAAMESDDTATILKWLSAWNESLRMQIIALNLFDLIVDSKQVRRLLDLCPMVSRLRFSPTSAISQDIYRRLVNHPTCSRIDISGTFLEDIPFDKHEKISGISINIHHEKDWQDKLKILKQNFPHLQTLRIYSRTISTLDDLPKSVKILICNNTPIRSISGLPSNLELLNVQGCPLEIEPKVPRHCVIIR